MATQIGLTKQQILENVSGYRQRSGTGAKADALEKMFERDKDDLRALGIPIETIGDLADPNDLREARYRIPQAEYDLPADITFSPADLAVLTLAASVWREESFSQDAQSGLRKIRALGIDVDEPIIGFAPRLELTHPSFAPLQDAIEHARVVSFPYLKPGEDAPLLRRVSPLALVDMENRWHVYGIDVDRDAERTFLLSRVVGDVIANGETFDPALRDGAGERALAGLKAVLDRSVAQLEVHAGSEAALRLARRADPSGSGIAVHYLDPEIFADELASYGPEVRVLAPESLREAVIGRLQATLASHTGGAQ
nr:WYL domain-containing protein [Microbacterium gorillae]